MVNNSVLFWNVDTQIDFVEPDGKLYVQDAEKLKFKWQEITSLAKEYNIRIVNTADSHTFDSKEISLSPNLINTFPVHCIKGTKGEQFISETKPKNALVFDWNKHYNIINELSRNPSRNIIIKKDAFNVFVGNPYSEEILKILQPKIVIVYGVTTNVCVDFAVMGLVKKVPEVFVISDAIKELATIPLPFEEWKRSGVKMQTTIQLTEFIKGYFS